MRGVRVGLVKMRAAVLTGVRRSQSHAPDGSGVVVGLPSVGTARAAAETSCGDLNMQVPSGRSGQRTPILRRKPGSSSRGEQPHADPNDHEPSRVDRTGQATEPFSSGSSRRHRKCKVSLNSQTDRCSTSPCNRQPNPSSTALRDLHGRAAGRPVVERRLLSGPGEPGRPAPGGAGRRPFGEPAAARRSMLRTSFVIRRLSDDQNRHPFGKSVNLHGTITRCLLPRLLRRIGAAAVLTFPAPRRCGSAPSRGVVLRLAAVGRH